ncbi:uncharacterized protein LOC131944166 [Physella acuta]|uniref:uncharacterized protein LOC131944166 n=1 Tax=Physella acuta TaxID=109671 RepID=UPI0027DBCB41|nr:uncharacterized protein LOC131944166 [Physella acuta]
MAKSMPEYANKWETDLDLIVIGKTGSGKSAVGNSIIGEDVFRSSYNTTSITKYPDYAVTEFEGRIIQVVDCPGVLDTDIDKSSGNTLVKQALKNAILANPQGYHAFLFVFKFGNRYTEEEQVAIATLKDLLGKDCIKKYGIVVLTNGDTFDYNVIKKGKTKAEYIQEQQGPFKQLLDECGNRMVVFDNITSDENKRRDQYPKCDSKKNLSKKDLDIILIGKTGNGKSSSGNSILNTESFEPSYGVTSKTKTPNFDWCSIDDRIIHVVDSPGVIDTGCSTQEGEDLVKKALQSALLANPQGYHAFIVVIKFALRYTNEEQKAVEILKNILGNDFLQNFGIILMTNGDTFEYECRKNPNLNLELYCKEQKGAFQELLQECNSRIVIFNNLTDNDIIKINQVRELIKIIDELKTSGMRYTNEDFKRAEHIHDYIQNLPDSPCIRKDILKEYSLILQKVKKKESDKENDVDFYKEMSLQIEKFVVRLERDKKTTDLHNKLLTNAKFLLENVKQKEKLCYKIKRIQDDTSLSQKEKIEQIYDIKNEILLLQSKVNDIHYEYINIKLETANGFFETVKAALGKLGQLINEAADLISSKLKFTSKISQKKNE